MIAIRVSERIFNFQLIRNKEFNFNPENVENTIYRPIESSNFSGGVQIFATIVYRVSFAKCFISFNKPSDDTTAIKTNNFQYSN
jgi:hypothetical protein